MRYMKYVIVMISLMGILAWTEEHEEKSKKKHLVTLLGGMGSKGYDMKQVGSTVKVDTRKGFVFGAGYAQEVGLGLYLGGQVISNGTLLGTLSAGF